MKTEIEQVKQVEGVVIDGDWSKRGAARARQFLAIDKGGAKATTSVMSDFREIVTSSRSSAEKEMLLESWHDGFKTAVSAARDRQLPCATAAKVASQIGKLVKNAIYLPQSTAKLLEDNKGLHATLEGMENIDSKGKVKPKAEKAPGTSTPAAATLTNPTPPVTVSEAGSNVNIADLLAVITKACENMVAQGQQKDAPFAEYIGRSLLDAMEYHKAQFQVAYKEHDKNGILNKADLRKALDLPEVKKAA